MPSAAASSARGGRSSTPTTGEPERSAVSRSGGVMAQVEARQPGPSLYNADLGRSPAFSRVTSMLKRYAAVITIIGAAACSRGEVSNPSPSPAAASTAAAGERQYLLERVGDAAVVQLYADGFQQLPLK